MAKVGEDCHFFYYSACKKGPACQFRHCEAAKGTEIVCENWNRSGSCPKINCDFRHAQIDKNRSSIPCFWEKQSTGCQKEHCPFKHLSPRPKFTENPTSTVRTIKDRLGDGGKSKVMSGGTNDHEKTEKRLTVQLTDDTDVSVSDSEVSSGKKRRRVCISDLFKSDETPSSNAADRSESTLMKPAAATTGQKKICLRKPTGETEITSTDNNTDQPQERKPRIWRRKSASPNLKANESVKPAATMGSPPLAESTPTSQPPAAVDQHRDAESSVAKKDETEVVEKLKEDKPSSVEDDEPDEIYKAKLIDIFGADLAEMYITQGIKLDLSQYP